MVGLTVQPSLSLSAEGRVTSVPLSRSVQELNPTSLVAGDSVYSGEREYIYLKLRGSWLS